MARELVTDDKVSRELVSNDHAAREPGTVLSKNGILPESKNLSSPADTPGTRDHGNVTDEGRVVGKLPEIFAGDPFQIIYTSGSTGAPKGVVNCHQLAICTLTDGEDTPDNRKKHRFFSEGFERVLMDCNPAFALSGGLYFRAFLNEKTLVMATEEEVQTPSSLAGCIRRTGGK